MVLGLEFWIFVKTPQPSFSFPSYSSKHLITKQGPVEAKREEKMNIDAPLRQVSYLPLYMGGWMDEIHMGITRVDFKALQIYEM